MIKNSKKIIWFREDLRVEDNTALRAAVKAADHGVIGVFIIPTDTWKKHHKASCQVELLLYLLKDLSQQLAQKNIPLLIRVIKNDEECPVVLNDLMELHGADALYANIQYGVDENCRDDAVTKKLIENKKSFFLLEDQVVIPPQKILTQTGSPYQIFTPFKKAWISLAESAGYYLPDNALIFSEPTNILPDPVPTKIHGFSNKIDISSWPKSTTAVYQRLNDFLKESVHHYHEQRDFPAVNGTSQLGPYLALGVLSPRQSIQRMMESSKARSLSSLLNHEGMSVWLSELIWREFYRYLMYHFPRVSRDKAFKIETDKLIWSKNIDHFNAWCEGRTGIPLVDAAMRCLNQTGWMHNRLRMVVAMFLTKNLWIDWRWGERYFMERLIDGDFPSNNGGWQWSASTGSDAVPYFRVFNPVTQSQRFDPEGVFIRQYCPELAGLNNKEIHLPTKHAIVDLKISRQKAIEAFAQLGHAR